MAQPILTYTPPTETAAERRTRLDAALAQHSDALIALCGLIGDLQDGGAIELLRGVAASRPEIVAGLSEAANTPESIAALRNIASLFRILGAIDPDVFHDLADRVTRTSEPEPHQAGLWKTLRRLGGKESLRALGAAAYGLQVFGQVLISRRPRRP